MHRKRHRVCICCCYFIEFHWALRRHTPCYKHTVSVLSCTRQAREALDSSVSTIKYYKCTRQAREALEAMERKAAARAAALDAAEKAMHILLYMLLHSMCSGAGSRSGRR